MIIDLHTHSYYSADGRLSIPELLNHYSNGDIVGLTDHETIGGCEEFKETASQRGIESVLGVEWFLRDCCHIISYFINDITQDFMGFIKERRMKEKHCMCLIYDKIKKKYNIPSYEEILESKVHPENILGVAALANYISKSSGLSFKKSVKMLRDLRAELSDNDRPMPFSPKDLIKRINDWHGISVLAHPYKNSFEKDGRSDRTDVENMVRDLANKGIDGIELYSDGSNIAELKHLLSLSEELGLVVSVGSDFHNDSKGLNPAELNDLNDGIKSEVKKWIMTKN